MARTDTIGTVYLLHFSEPVGHAEHYLGWALDHHARVDDHLCGKGSRLVAAAVRRGIHIELVRTWPNVDRNFERRLKNGTHKARCPLCKPDYNKRAAKAMRLARLLKRAGGQPSC
jgi:hypothetical protein